MSGGVDSSVTAALLAQKVIQALLIINNDVVTVVVQDYDLSAVLMRNWDTRDESGTDRGCEWEQDWEDVQGVCKLLDIPCDLVRYTLSHLSTP
jgi:tRNA U34 2-thiouridine synthase MnmA/TrmU